MQKKADKRQRKVRKYLLSSLQTVVCCTQNTAGKALFFFAEFHFPRILQNASKTSSTPVNAQRKDRLNYEAKFAKSE